MQKETQQKAKRLGGLAVLILMLLAPTGTSSLEASSSTMGLQQQGTTDPVATPGLEKILPEGPVAVSSPLEGEEFNAPACAYTVPAASTKAGAWTRPSLRVGINDFGSIGTGSPGTVGDGFQMPMGQAGESLAIGFWGEGYLINYNGATHTFHPSWGSSGDLTRVDDFYLESARYVTYRVTMALNAQQADPALVDFEFTLDKEKCDLTLRTTIENQGDEAIDLYYKRYVDWDNVGAQGGLYSVGFFDQTWTGSPTSAVATRYVGNSPTAKCSTTSVGTTLSHQVDLYAWDDRSTTGTGSTYHPTSYNGDGFAAFHFERDSLPPGGTWDTFLVYECSTFTRLTVDDGPIDVDYDHLLSRA